jgi:DNA-binding MarR family transcriptional regulator
MTAIQTQSRLESWVSFLRAHAAITRQLNADLLNAHGLTLSDYEVLLRLSSAEYGMMRRVDLAQSVLLTASGITRLLDGLERAGLVEKGSCASDARVTYAVLTETGSERFRAARGAHLRDVEALFGSRFSDEEREQLTALLARLLDPGEDELACTAEPA